jgi:hypothetical protein
MSDAFKPANNDRIVNDDEELAALFPASKDKLPNVPSFKGNQYRLWRPTLAHAARR